MPRRLPTDAKPGSPLYPHSPFNYTAHDEAHWPGNPGFTPAGCKVSMHSQVVILNDPNAPPSSTVTDFPFDWEIDGPGYGDYDPYGFFDAGSPTILTIPSGCSGIYMVTVFMDLDVTTSGATVTTLQGGEWDMYVVDSNGFYPWLGVRWSADLQSGADMGAEFMIQGIYPWNLQEGDSLKLQWRPRYYPADWATMYISIDVATFSLARIGLGDGNYYLP